MIELGRFFPGPMDPESNREMDLVALNCRFNHALLAGPPQSGKTSLLLQYAVNSVRDPSARVIFICQQKNLENNPPRMPQGMHSSAEAFNRIQIRYLETASDLRKYFSFFHCLPLKPCLVIIDGLFDFFTHGSRATGERGQHARERDMEFAKTLAYAYDAVSQSVGNGPACELLVSETTVGNPEYGGEQPRLQFLYSRWLPLLFHIHGGEEQSYKLVVHGNMQAKPHVLATAKYSFKDNIRLEELEL